MMKYDDEGFRVNVADALAIGDLEKSISAILEALVLLRKQREDAVEILAHYSMLENGLTAKGKPIYSFEDWDGYRKQGKRELEAWEKVARFSLYGPDASLDSSLFSMVIFWLAYDYIKDGFHIRKDKYWLESNASDSEGGVSKPEYYLKGDTMNSYFTTVDSGSQNGRYLEVLSGEDTHDKKWWLRYVMNNYDCLKSKVHPSLLNFMELYYTIGNFITVPIGKENGGDFNNRGFSGKSGSRDYWDLALQAIYKYYDELKNGKNASLDQNFLDKEDAKISKKWLKSFKPENNKQLSSENNDSLSSWDKFVESNHMASFVSYIKKDEEYGEPKILWDNHSFASPLPKLNEKCNGYKAYKEYNDYFINASHRIEKRGMEIAEAAFTSLETELKKKSKEKASCNRDKIGLTDEEKKCIEELAREMAPKEDNKNSLNTEER